MPARRISASWILPVTGEPIRDGAVLIDSTGLIVAIGPDHQVPRTPDIESDHHPGCIVTPGLVNTHTHLELTGLGPVIAEADFPSWIRMLRARKATRSQAEFERAAETGLRQCWAAGVTTVADTGDTGAAARALATLGGRGIAYQEVFGPHPDQVPESLAALAALVERTRAMSSDRVQIGVSPHAPYTVSEPLYRAVAVWARERGLPIALHLAESAEETELVTGGTGGFAAAWARRDIPVPVAARSPVAYVDRSGVLGPDTLCIHVIRVDAEDIGILKARGVGIAHCPISNAAHGHGTAPLRRFLEAGIRTGLGTDSELSSHPLDLCGEARVAMRLAGLDARSALHLLTLGGAEALGLSGKIGTLAPGRCGDVAVFNGRGSDDPFSAVISSTARATYIEGEPVYRGEG